MHVLSMPVSRDEPEMWVVRRMVLSVESSAMQHMHRHRADPFRTVWRVLHLVDMGHCS